MTKNRESEQHDSREEGGNSGINDMNGGNIGGNAKVAGIIFEGGWLVAIISIAFISIAFIIQSKISNMNTPNLHSNQKLPKTLIDSWETTEGPVKISFKVKDEMVKDLKIVYQYGDSPDCQLKNIQIKQSNNGINETIPIKNDSFSFTTQAEYTVDGQKINDKNIAIEGTLDMNNSFVKGKLDLVQTTTLKNQGQDNSISCIEARKGIPWTAEKSKLTP